MAVINDNMDEVEILNYKIIKALMNTADEVICKKRAGRIRLSSGGMKSVKRQLKKK